MRTPHDTEQNLVMNRHNERNDPGNSQYPGEKIIIGDRHIGQGYRPFIIAEMSGNHNRSLERALDIVEAAARAGAHALKLQTYTADTMTIDVNLGNFIINDPGSLWYGRTLYDLYQEAHTPWEWHEPIFNRCKALGLICLSTPFDTSAVDFLETLNTPAYKVASFEITDLPLIERIAATGKPVIMSTGMATAGELDEAVQAARTCGCNDIILLKCTSTYPASPNDSNLRTISHMRTLFNCEVGISDHTVGIGVALAAVAMGATVIEKHFTLSRADGGVDAPFSIEPAELKQLVEETKRAWQSLGRVQYGPTRPECKSLVFRRSIYVTADIDAGTVLTPENMRPIRPAGGLPPKYYQQILGKKVNRSVRKGTPLSWDMIG